MAGFATEVQTLHNDLGQYRGDVNPDDHGAAILGGSVLDLRRAAGDRNKLGGIYKGWLDSNTPWRQVPNSVEPYNEQRALSDIGAEGAAQKYPELYLPQLETMNFGFIFALYQRTAALGDVGSDLGDVMTSAKTQLSAEWTGAAADAALKQFDKVTSSARVYKDSNGLIASHAFGLWKTTRESLVGLAGCLKNPQLVPQFHGMKDQDYKDWYPRMAYFRALSQAGINSLEDFSRATFFGIASGTLPEPPAGLFPVLAATSADGMARQLAAWQNWLNGMSVRYSFDVKLLRDSTRATATYISSAFDEFNTAILGLREKDGDVPKDDPFRELRPPAATTTPARTDTATAASNTGPASHGGGGGYGGGGYGSGAVPSYSPPTATMPTVPSAADYASMTQPGADPTAGLTAASSATQPETVTIADGDRQISVQSPDGQGNVKVTVDDGDGKPKSYTMDFSQGAGATKGMPGATGGAAGDDKVVIKDGDSTITAEKADGGDGQIKITIDDGTGDPTTYDVDFGDDQTQAPADQQPADQQPTGHQQQNDQQHAANGSSPAPGSGAPHQAAAVHGGAMTGVADAATSSGGATVDPQTTTPQADAGPLSGAGAAGMAGSATGDHGHHAAGFDADPGSDVAAASGPGDAQLAAAPDPGNGAGAGAAGMGGMPMMGGMGGGGGGGDGGGGRAGGSAWRTTGNLFADEEPAFEEGELTSDDPASW